MMSRDAPNPVFDIHRFLLDLPENFAGARKIFFREKIEIKY